MKEYQKRVIEEKKELGEKVNKLFSFIAGDRFKCLESDEKVRLRKQLKSMTEYSGILKERIDNF